MRRQNWQQALARLRKAQKLAPTVPGIRLNIGLVYYHESDFRSAIAPFESVVGDDPNSSQARYLLGLCYFFTDRYAAAARILEPLWPQEQNDLNYLYVLGNAAGRSDPSQLTNRAEIENRALSRLVDIGKNTAEYHLLMGKAFLNRQEEDKAIPELEEAIRLDPKLPFAHFNLGLALLTRRDFDRARDEFQKDLAIEPDVAFNFDRLGLICFYWDDNAGAEKNFREALRRDPHLPVPITGLRACTKGKTSLRRRCRRSITPSKSSPTFRVIISSKDGFSRS